MTGRPWVLWTTPDDRVPPPPVMLWTSIDFGRNWLPTSPAHYPADAVDTIRHDRMMGFERRWRVSRGNLQSPVLTTEELLRRYGRRT